MLFKPIKPTTLSLLTTMHCTAQCKNCCFQCSPRKRERMDLNHIYQYIDKILSYYPSIKTIVFSGGECTSIKSDLLKGIIYANKKGLTTRIVTNAYWATSYEKAYSFLVKLKEHGLNEINYSTGDDHQEWIPYENIINACLASRNLGFNTVVNVEAHLNSSFNRTIFIKDKRISKYIGNNMSDSNCIKIMQGVWMPVTDEAKEERKHQKKEVPPHYNTCNSIFHTIAITPNGDIYCCCGLTCLQNQTLKVGNIQYSTKASIESNQFEDLLKIWIHTEGPIKILEFLYRNTPIKKNEIDYSMHICEVCMMLFNSPHFIADIKKHINQILPNIMLKYNLSIK